jgi:AbrB family looped-hinge helix DNA binding protein
MAARFITRRKTFLTMQTTVSAKGRVALPRLQRSQLDIRAGDTLDANIEDGRIVLTPRRKRGRRVKIRIRLPGCQFSVPVRTRPP